jgi:CarD family transcriptional regulator
MTRQKKLLEDEISIAMGLSEKEVESMIHVKLEPPGATPKIKHIIEDFDDEDDDLMDDVSSKKNKRDDDDDDDDSDEDSSDEIDSEEDFGDDDEE